MDYRELLRAGRWFRSLPERFQSGLLEMAHVRRIGARELVYPSFRSEQGQPCELFGVVEGKVRVGRTTPEGRPVILTVLQPPSWAGEMGLFDGLPRSYDLTAEEDTVIVEVPTGDLVTLLEREPTLWRELARLSVGKLRLAMLGMEDAATSTVRERVAHRVVMMADGYGEWADRSYSFVSISQDTLATMVASSRQSVNQALAELEGDGVLRRAYGGIEVLDFEGLRRAGSVEVPRSFMRPSEG